MAEYALFAVAAPGLAPLVAGELRALGLDPGAPEPGGVPFAGSLEAIARANLWLRTASRVLVRVDSFSARAFWELEKQTRQLPWERYLRAGAPLRLRTTCRQSRLYHSGAVAERVAAAIGARLGGPAELRRALDDKAQDGHEDAEAEAPGAGRAGAAGGDGAGGDGAGGDGAGGDEDGALVVVRLLRDRCTLSIDSSGPLLHRRGYRQATARAPLRETLAAALLLAGGWDRRAPLLDPLCGAGTIAIEAALLARGRAPGRARRFAFMDWPAFDPALWERLVTEADVQAEPAAPGAIQASDRDEGAIAAAEANAARAGVAGDIEWRVRALSAIEPPPGPGWLVANPPYGVRVGDRDRLRNLYARLGDVARAQLPGWQAVLLSADAALARQTGLPFEPLLSTTNGGLAVQVLRALVPGR
jgi:putative N6-adenine-specific DNA methylase